MYWATDHTVAQAQSTQFWYPGPAKPRHSSGAGLSWSEQLHAQAEHEHGHSHGHGHGHGMSVHTNCCPAVLHLWSCTDVSHSSESKKRASI